MNGSCALTTFDNPYNPFEQFSDWFLFDVEKGYNTCAYLDRIAHTSDQFSEEENNQEIERHGEGSPKSHPLPHRGGLKKISGGIFWEWGLPPRVQYLNELTGLKHFP